MPERATRHYPGFYDPMYPVPFSDNPTLLPANPETGAPAPAWPTLGNQEVNVNYVFFYL